MISNSITQTFHVPWGTKEIGDNCGQATCTSKFAPNFSWPYCSCQQPAYTCPALTHTNMTNQNYWKNSLKQLKNLKGEPTKHFHVCRFIFCDLAPVVQTLDSAGHLINKFSWNWLRVQWIVLSTFWTSMPRWSSYLTNISRVWRASSPTHIGNLREYPYVFMSFFFLRCWQSWLVDVTNLTDKHYFLNVLYRSYMKLCQSKKCKNNIPWYWNA